MTFEGSGLSVKLDDTDWYGIKHSSKVKTVAEFGKKIKNNVFALISLVWKKLNDQQEQVKIFNHIVNNSNLCKPIIK